MKSCWSSLTLFEQALYQGVKSQKVEAGKRREEKEVNLKRKVIKSNTGSG